ncbi:uncharacterized protein LOC124818872 [Hydra vulgaris]|uniref:uncharacterized protein LOC124818872 n=1 Tax=Hydra vulgaris TaxID=6087 RepID=UPI001F5FA862|nr:uncharacterized protein LOC124818872 [Hydra vulgaris]
MVRSVKRILRKLLKTARLSYIEVLTILAEIEVVTNKRPLTFLYEQLGDEPLSPNHLVYGKRISVETLLMKNGYKNMDIKKRVVYTNSILEHIWNRWRSEYLTELREFHRSNNKCGSKNNIKKGDVVIIQDANLVRGLWKLGVIENLSPSTDGQVRAANVRCVSAGKITYLSRPVNKLCLREENKFGVVETTFVNENNIQLYVTTVGGGSVALIKLS